VITCPKCGHRKDKVRGDGQDRHSQREAPDPGPRRGHGPGPREAVSLALPAGGQAQFLYPQRDPAANREPPVNPERTEIRDPAVAAAEIKQMARDMGADVVGVAEYDQRFAFTQAGEPTDKFAIVFGIGMSFDNMADIGPRSQDEVHRVYYRLDDIGVRLAQQIAAYGYPAYLAGLGELGKHGSASCAGTSIRPPAGRISTSSTAARSA
jgi:hypothetical protein